MSDGTAAAIRLNGPQRMMADATSLDSEVEPKTHETKPLHNKRSTFWQYVRFRLGMPDVLGELNWNAACGGEIDDEVEDDSHSGNEIEKEGGEPGERKRK
ncbi:hypothetical protein BJ742DRAFT_773598 [Cladochytrium replicatum]|nr:hypothetical protein BJ742DRAFT_773598 [Cladochytrium replicatum]